MKKILSILIWWFLLLIMTIWHTNADFIPRTSTQYSSTVEADEIISSFKWNSVVYDISNLIADIWGLKQYIDANLVTYFVENGTKLEYNIKNVKLWKDLTVWGITTVTMVEIPVDWLSDSVIITDDIKNGTITTADLDPNISFWIDTTFIRNWSNIYYTDWNVWIGTNIADEKLTITDWNLKIIWDWNGVIFPDGSTQYSSVVDDANDMKLTGDQEVDGIKNFKTSINFISNIYNFPIDASTWNIVKEDTWYIEENETIWYYKTGAGSATYDTLIKRTGEKTLKVTIWANQYIEVKSQATIYHTVNEFPKLLPNTTYTMWGWIRTALIWDSDHWAFFIMLTHDDNGVSQWEFKTDYVKWTQEWTYYETTFTTTATTTSWHIEFRIYGHTWAKTLEWDAWFDVNSVTLVWKGLIINEISNDETLADESITAIVTERAVKVYIDSLISKEDGVCWIAWNTWYWEAPTSELCEFWEVVNMVDNWDYTWSWECAWISGWLNDYCWTKTCQPNIVWSTTTQYFKQWCNQWDTRLEWWDIWNKYCYSSNGTNVNWNCRTYNDNWFNVKWNRIWIANGTSDCAWYGNTTHNGSTSYRLEDYRSGKWKCNITTWAFSVGWWSWDNFCSGWNNDLGTTAACYDKCSHTDPWYDTNYCSSLWREPLEITWEDTFKWTKALDENTVDRLKIMLWNKCWELLYQKSIHGASSATWHSKVDWVVWTITVMKGSSRTIAGYNDLSWDTSSSYKNSSSTWIANLSTNVRSTTLNYPQYSTYNNNLYWPTFGWGHDWSTDSSMNFNYWNYHSYNNHPFNWQGIWTTLEVETFKVIDCATIDFDSTPWVDKTIKLSGGVRNWSNWQVAQSCNDYKNPSSDSYKYEWDIWDGIYTINAGSWNINVFCDMTRDGWGWTLVYKANGQHSIQTTWATWTAVLTANDYTWSWKLSDADIRTMYVNQYKVEYNGYGNLYCKFDNIATYADGNKTYKSCWNAYNAWAWYVNRQTTNYRNMWFSTRGMTNWRIIQLRYNDSRLWAHVVYWDDTGNTCDVKTNWNDRYWCHWKVWVK